jgi:hypothetical protein
VDDLTNFPLLDDNGQEVPIFDEEGFPIPRHEAGVEEVQTRLGILFDLRNLRDFFDGGLNIDLPDRPPTKYCIYPQAFTHNYGHFQANSLPEAFCRMVDAINVNVGLQSDRLTCNKELFGDDDEDYEDLLPSVTGIACQGYNELVHRVRGNGARHHDAQLGVITAAFAGSYAITEKAKRAQRQHARSISFQLPHQKFREKICDDDNQLNLEFRLENVYEIDLHRIKPQYRTGR